MALENPINVSAEGPGPEPLLLADEPQRLPREVLIISGICLLLAAVLRLLHVGYREVFGDEFWALEFISRGPGNLLDNFFHGRLPLYYETLAMWNRVAPVENSETLLRLPSVVFGLLTIAGFVFFAQRYLRRTAFVICVVAFALNPILVASSNHAAPFAMMGLWTVLSNYFCIRALDEGRRRNWILWGIYSFLGALTHPFFWFVIAAQFIFALARPHRTPRPFLLASAAGIFVSVALMIAAAVYANQRYPKLVDVTTPSIDELARALVAVLLGDFPRYGYMEKDFIQAVMYLFVIVTLGLSVFYYRQRAEEAAAVPENVVFIDMTQDVVGRWNRLSLASFLMFQWTTFLVPALGIWMVGTYASDMRLEPEYFLVCLPSLMILVAAGIDAARPSSAASVAAGWRRGLTIGLGFVFILITAVYSLQVLSDRGYGIEATAKRLDKEKFDPARDTLLIAYHSGLEKTMDRYLKGFPAQLIRGRESVDEMKQRTAQASANRQRVFVFYNSDFRRFGKAVRSPVREWFEERARAGEFKLAEKYTMSKPEKTALFIYSRVDAKPGTAAPEATAPAPATPAAAPKP